MTWHLRAVPSDLWPEEVADRQSPLATNSLCFAAWCSPAGNTSRAGDSLTRATAFKTRAAAQYGTQYF